MKLLFFQWNAFMQKGIERALKRMNVEYEVFSYIFKDWDRDEEFQARFRDKLLHGRYDAVLSVNFAPVISEVCEELDIPYVSWVYDAPLHIRKKETLKNSCNTVFFFDRAQAQLYAGQGVHAYHMPLAGDAESFGLREGGYDCDASLVGKLYRSDYSYLCGPLDAYSRGYLEGVVEAQKTVYGGCFIDECLDDGFLSRINEQYLKASGQSFTVSREELRYAVGTEITGRERYTALALLQNRCSVKLYSGDFDDRLKNVSQPGYVDYYTQMPQVFKKSRINLNISLKLIESGIPLRVFDVLASGGFLITNYQPELAEVFEPGEDLVVYESMTDLVTKVMWYLKHDEERERIARNGFLKVSGSCTFEQRLKAIFAKLQANGIIASADADA